MRSKERKTPECLPNGAGSYRFWKLALACVILSFVLIAPAILKAEVGDPWEFVREFTFLPNSNVQVEGHYVAGLFYHPEKNLYALVIYTADCNSGSCTVKDNVAYAVTDAQGVLIRRYVEPREESLIKRVFAHQRFI